MRTMTMSETLMSEEAIRQADRMVLRFSEKVQTAKQYVNQLGSISDNDRIVLQKLIDDISLAAIGRTAEGMISSVLVSS